MLSHSPSRSLVTFKLDLGMVGVGIMIVDGWTDEQPEGKEGE